MYPDQAVFLATDGSAGDGRAISYDSDPEDILMCPPYIIALLTPPSSAPQKQEPAHIQLHTISSLQLMQDLTVPLTASNTALAGSKSAKNAVAQGPARLLTCSTGNKAPLVVVTPSNAPDASTASTAQSSSLYLLEMSSWADQIDEMVSQGQYEAALSLLESLEDIVLPDKAERRRKLRALHGLEIFLKRRIDQAIDIFIDLDLNPAKVVALYPQGVSGKLFKPAVEQEELFGGRTSASVKAAAEEEATQLKASRSDEPASDTPVASAAWKLGLGSSRRPHQADSDTASVRSGESKYIRRRQASGMTDSPVEQEGVLMLQASCFYILIWFAQTNSCVDR